MEKYDFWPFVEAMNKTFKEMTNVSIVNGSIEENVDLTNINADVSASIGLTTNDDKAIVILTVLQKVALQITEELIGMKVSLDNPLVRDAVGELLNIIIGSAQRNSNKKFNFSLAVSISGTSHGINASNSRYTRKIISKLEGQPIGLYLIEGQSASR